MKGWLVRVGLFFIRLAIVSQESDVVKMTNLLPYSWLLQKIRKEQQKVSWTPFIRVYKIYSVVLECTSPTKFANQFLQ